MALERGGEAVDDPIAWFDKLPSGVQAYWQAYWRVEPFGMQWHQAAQVATAVERLTRTVSIYMGGKPLPAEFGDSMPSDWIGEPDSEERVPIQEQLRATSSGIGASSGD